MLKIIEHFSEPRVPGRISLRNLPSEHDATHFDGPPPVALAGAACRFNDRPVAVQLHQDAPLEQPKQPQVIHAGEWPLSVAAEQIKRPPTQCLSTGRPTLNDEAPTVV